jgi:hypothetical protein
MGPGAKSFGRHPRSLASRLGLGRDSPRHFPAQVLAVVIVYGEGPHVLVAAEALHRSEIAREIERRGDRRMAQTVRPHSEPDLCTNASGFASSLARRKRLPRARRDFPPSGRSAVDKKLPGIVAEDIGKCAYGIFKRGREFIGKTVGVAGEHLTGAQMAAALTKALGQEVRYNEVSPDVYRSFGFPGAEDLGNMFQFKRDFEKGYCGARNLELSRSLNPELQTFAQWLAQNKDRIPLD